MKTRRLLRVIPVLGAAVALALSAPSAVAKHKHHHHHHHHYGQSSTPGYMY